MLRNGILLNQHSRLSSFSGYHKTFPCSIKDVTIEIFGSEQIPMSLFNPSLNING